MHERNEEAWHEMIDARDAEIKGLRKALQEISALQHTTVGNVFAATDIADRALAEHA